MGSILLEMREQSWTANWPDSKEDGTGKNILLLKYSRKVYYQLKVLQKKAIFSTAAIIIPSYKLLLIFNQPNSCMIVE